MKPVTPNASPEARALLRFFYHISGTYLLTGQHNFPNTQGMSTGFAARYMGRTPVLYSTDWGFAKAGDKDSYLARQKIVEQIIRENRLGAIITLCWHAVPPTTDEPVTFQPLPGADSAHLASVQGRLTGQQFRYLLTPGTRLYKHWCQQVDTIAVYLKELQDAHVPIIWRPYHEMNGNWFWWGGRQGKYSTVRLYRQLFDRLVHYHKLNNLIWMWNMDRPTTPERSFSNFYVGKEYFDIASLDVYGSDFRQIYYDSLLALAQGKPIALGEVGNPPTPEVLKRQPDWTYYVIWAGMVRNTTKKQYLRLIQDSRVLTLEDAAYRMAIAPYRKADGLPPLPVEVTNPIYFSGIWKFDEEASQLGNSGSSQVPSRLEVKQVRDSLFLKSTLVSEYGPSSIRQENLDLDGTETQTKAPFGNSPMITTAHLSPMGDTLFLDSRLTLNFGGHTSRISTEETWTLSGSGKRLSIRQLTRTLQGTRKITTVYRRE